MFLLLPQVECVNVCLCEETRLRSNNETEGDVTGKPQVLCKVAWA